MIYYSRFIAQTISSDIFGGILPFIEGDSSSPDEYEVQSFAAASTVIGTHTIPIKASDNKKF